MSDNVNKKRWTQEEVGILIANYHNAERKELQRLLPNKTWAAIHLKANNLGLKREDWLKARKKKHRDRKE